MSAVYLIALAGVTVSILWLAIDAVISVSRKPRWEAFAPRTLMLVHTEERRRQAMSFVGSERRQASADARGEEEDRLVA